MKVGIITYHCSNNYGAQLQAYALRRVIQKLGHKAEVLDCNTVGKGKIFTWSLHSLRAFLGSLRNNILSLVSERERHRLFHDFSQTMIGLSKPCLTKRELDEKSRCYDFMITGSDQVWHPQICEGQTCFFLDLPIKGEQKISYAPSFGVPDYNADEVNRYMPFIKGIKHLSVREEQGRKIIKKYTGRDAKLVLDPTMLLTYEEWDDIAISPKYKDYLFYFTILDEPDGADDMVRRMAKERGLKIVRIGGVRDIAKPGFINARASGPREFLGLIRGASFIVTSSFHGSVFSILYEKEFLSICNNNNRNSRLETLMSNLGLSNYLVHDVQTYSIQSYQCIDYNNVNKTLHRLREDSMSFLNNAIK